METWIEQQPEQLEPRSRVLVEWAEWGPLARATRYWTPLDGAKVIEEGQPVMLVATPGSVADVETFGTWDRPVRTVVTSTRLDTEATTSEQLEAIDALAKLPTGPEGEAQQPWLPEGTWARALEAARPTKPETMSRDDVLTEAGRLIGGDRAQTYGDAAESFTRIGKLWSALLGVEVSASDVARCMVAMKLSRLHGSPAHADSWIDAAGYAALGAEIAGARP